MIITPDQGIFSTDSTITTHSTNSTHATNSQHTKHTTVKGEEKMKKRMHFSRAAKAAVSIVMACSLMVPATICASAADSVSASASSFSDDWERYKEADDGLGVLTYGFNTFAIDEDYAWASHDTKSHYASLKNAKGWHTGSAKAGGKLSRVDVTHRGTSVSYYMYY